MRERIRDSEKKVNIKSNKIWTTEKVSVYAYGMEFLKAYITIFGHEITII